MIAKRSFANCRNQIQDRKIFFFLNKYIEADIFKILRIC